MRPRRSVDGIRRSSSSSTACCPGCHLDEDGRVNEARIFSPEALEQVSARGLRRPGREHDRGDQSVESVVVSGTRGRGVNRFHEQLIRSYDPCISWARHFLDLHLEETS